MVNTRPYFCLFSFVWRVRKKLVNREILKRERETRKVARIRNRHSRIGGGVQIGGPFSMHVPLSDDR